MTEDRMKALKTGRNIGAMVGGIIFMVFGIVPAFYFGSFGMLTLITHLVGPVDPGILVRMLLVVGIIMGLVCTLFVSIVVGSVLGTTLAAVTDAVASLARPSGKEALAKSQS